MSTTRGARYLLRNGLDYLNYKEYERALKFLRETETRKDELNDAERLLLKQSIEKAQRGLRQAADTESPYALSDRTRGRNGFSAAKPETRIAGQTQPDRLRIPARQVMANRSTPNHVPANDSDDQGEPIWLASGDKGASEPNSQTAETSRSSSPENLHQPRQLPEIPNLPKFSQDTGDADIQSNDLKRVDNQVAASQPSRMNASQLELAPVPRQSTPAVPDSAAAATTVAPVLPPPSTIELIQPSSATTAAVSKDGANRTLNDDAAGISLSPAPSAVTTTDATKAAHTEAEEPVVTPMVKQPASVAASKSQDTTTPPVNEPLSALPVPVTSPRSTPSATEKADDTAPTQVIQTDVVDLSKPTVVPSTVSPTEAPPETNELPPLPADLSGSRVQRGAGTELAPSLIPEDVATIPADGLGSELPPLPSDLSQPANRIAETPATPLISNPAPEPMAPRSTNHTEEETAATVSAPSGGPVVNMPTEAAIPAPGQAVNAALSSSTKPEVAVTGAEPIDGPSNAAAAESRQEAVPEVPPVAAPAEEEQSHGLPTLPPAIENRPSSTEFEVILPKHPTPPSTLRPELKREVEIIVRKQEDELRRRQQVQDQPMQRGRDSIISDLRAQTQLDISRAPSPAEARPIKAIPVPEDWVPLAPRNWDPQRKYWAAAATCHLPLYFQDPVLERYGHSVEQFVGPAGRFLTYPLDDPSQSIQRNQILQPFFSAGLFAFQIAAWPYNLVMDPPWEAQYDLGYYRPGDPIPTDLYWLPLHGYGPPLRGKNY